jgi:hypothetical protein
MEPDELEEKPRLPYLRIDGVARRLAGEFAAQASALHTYIKRLSLQISEFRPKAIG